MNDIDKRIRELERELSELKRLKEISRGKAHSPLKDIQTGVASERIRSTQAPKIKQPSTSATSFKPPVNEAAIRKQVEAELTAKFQAQLKAQANKIHRFYQKQAKEKGYKLTKYGAPKKPRGRIAISKDHDPYKILRERPSKAKKEAAQAYHLSQAQKAGFKTYKRIPKEPRDQSARSFSIWIDIKRLAKERDIDISNVRLDVDPKNLKYSIQHMAKFRSFLTNPKSKEKMREGVWEKVLSGQIALKSKDLEKELRLTRDIVGDHYGIDS